MKKTLLEQDIGIIIDNTEYWMLERIEEKTILSIEEREKIKTFIRLYNDLLGGRIKDLVKERSNYYKSDMESLFKKDDR